MTKTKNKEENIAKEFTSEFVRIGRYLNETVPVTDTTGKVISSTLKPLMVEVYPRDILQQIIGATLLAVPLAYTEEVWKLGQELPWTNIYLVSIVSILFIGGFVYYNFYKKYFRKHILEFIKRTISVYVISLAVSFLILTLVDKAPLDMFWDITLKRMILVSLPASMSASIADVIK